MMHVVGWLGHVVGWSGLLDVTVLDMHAARERGGEPNAAPALQRRLLEHGVRKGSSIRA